MRHMFDFCCGKTHELQNLIKVTAQKLSEEHPLYGYYLGIKSFVLCESGNYLEALKTGLNAYKVREDNIYSIHAVAHAYHEMGKYQEIIDFLQKTMVIWVNNPGMQMHVYWHMALAQLNLLSFEKARKAFAEFYSLKSSDIAEQDLDAVGFLWRYRLCMPEDDRYDELWNQLAEKWSGCIGASMSYFYDIHAALSFVAIKKPFLIKKMIARSDGTGIPNGSHEVGIEILQAIYSYAMGQYYECALILSRTKERWLHIGGSHAQRELLSMTLQDSLYRSITDLQDNFIAHNNSQNCSQLNLYIYNKFKNNSKFSIGVAETINFSLEVKEQNHEPEIYEESVV